MEDGAQAAYVGKVRRKDFQRKHIVQAASIRDTCGPAEDCDIA